MKFLNNKVGDFMSKNRKLKKEDINKNNKRKISQKSREKFGLKLTVYLILRFFYYNH